MPRKKTPNADNQAQMTPMDEPTVEVFASAPDAEYVMREFSVEQPLYFDNVQEAIARYDQIQKKAMQDGQLAVAGACLRAQTKLLGLESDTAMRWANDAMMAKNYLTAFSPRRRGEEYLEEVEFDHPSYITNSES